MIIGSGGVYSIYANCTDNGDNIGFNSTSVTIEPLTSGGGGDDGAGAGAAAAAGAAVTAPAEEVAAEEVAPAEEVAIKRCPRCHSDMHLAWRETTTHRQRIWMCCGCEYWEGMYSRLEEQ